MEESNKHIVQLEFTNNTGKEITIQVYEFVDVIASEGFQRKTFNQAVQLLKAEVIKEKAAITEETLRQLLSQFGAHLANRDLPGVKKFIGNYVEKVIVYEKHVEVIFKLHIVDFAYGDEGSRTPVFNFLPCLE